MVCEICARFAEKQPPPQKAPATQRIKKYAPRPKRRIPKRSLQDMELRDDYAKVIREAREQKGWTQTELANQLIERLSLVRRIESGKMQPNIQVIEKLEKELEITLLISTSDIPEIKLESKLPGDMTLGDVVHLKKKKKKDED